MPEGEGRVSARPGVAMTALTPELETFMVEVVAAELAAPDIRLLTLRAPEGRSLPGFAPGAHLSVRIPPGGERANEMWRAYSLIGTGSETGGPQASWRIGVLREETGRGGSRFVHDEISVGDRLEVRLPPNGFPLNETEPGPVLLAGGIGITPLIPMARCLRARGNPPQLHYTCRTPDQHILLDELFAQHGTDLYIYADSDPHRRFDLDRFLAALSPGQPIYVCGPEGLIEALRNKARNLGWPNSAIHYELFADAAPAADAEAFEVELAGTGEVLEIPADKSLLDVLVEAGHFVMQDCRQGHCGLCSVAVRSGEILHNDTYLTDAQHAAGDVMQICVSRGKGRLVVEL